MKWDTTADVSWTGLGPRSIEYTAPAYNRNRQMSGVLGTIHRERLGELCRRHGISRLAVFGSAARGKLGPESDIDLLVEFVPGRLAARERSFKPESAQCSDEIPTFDGTPGRH